VGDQAGNALLGQPADVPCSVERMKARDGQARRIADVMEPGRSDEGRPIVLIEDPPGLVRPGCDCLDVAPPVTHAGQQARRLRLGPAHQLVRVHMATLPSCTARRKLEQSLQ
jgi:hypothetical protein